MYAVVRDYRGEASDVVAQAKQREASLRAVVSGVKGFVAYYALDTGNGGLATVSIYEDRAGAEESVRVAATWVRENMARWAPNPPTIIQGEAFIHFAR